MDRLKVFEGIPPPYDKKKRFVLASCMKVVKLKPYRRFAELSRLAHEVGWKNKALIETLEEKRKAKSAQYFEKKQEKLAIRKKAIVNVQDKIQELDDQILAMGHKVC